MRVPLFLEARHGSQKIKAVRKVASIKSSPIRRTSLHESDAVVPDNDCRSRHHDGFGHRGWVNIDGSKQQTEGASNQLNETAILVAVALFACAIICRFVADFQRTESCIKK